MMYNAISRLKDVRAVLASSTRLNGAYVFEALALWAIGMSIATLGMLAIDDRTLAGEPVWLKPFKFAVSFAILFATLGFAAGRLSSTWRHSRLIVASAAASGAAFGFEMSYITRRPPTRRRHTSTRARPSTPRCVR